MVNWALKTPIFKKSDHFVTQHKISYKFLQELHDEVRRSLVKLIPHQPYKVKKRFGNWRDQVVDWYNDWIINGFVHKKKQLFLFGKQDTGKTSFIRFLFGIVLNFWLFFIKSNKKM